MKHNPQPIFWRYILNQQVAPNELGLKTPYFFKITGPLQCGVFKQAVEVYTNHYHYGTGQPFNVKSQSFEDTRVNFQWFEFNLSKDEFVKKILAHPFDISTGYNYIFAITKIGENEFIFAVNSFHILTDTTTGYYFCELISEIYNSLLNQQALPEPEKFAQPKQPSDRNAIVNFWQEQLIDKNISCDFGGAKNLNQAAHVVTLDLPLVLCNKLKQVTRKHGCLAWMGLMAVYTVLLKQWTSQQEFVFNFPVDARDVENKYSPGCCAWNSLFKISVCEQQNLSMVMQTIKDFRKQQRDFTQCHWMDIFDELAIKDKINLSFTQAFLNLTTFQLQNCNTTAIQPESGGTFFDLDFGYELSEQIRIQFKGRSQIFSFNSIQRFAYQFYAYLHIWLNNPNLSVKQLLSYTPKKYLLREDQPVQFGVGLIKENIYGYISDQGIEKLGVFSNLTDAKLSYSIAVNLKRKFSNNFDLLFIDENNRYTIVIKSTNPINQLPIVKKIIQSFPATHQAKQTVIAFYQKNKNLRRLWANRQLQSYISKHLDVSNYFFVRAYPVVAECVQRQPLDQIEYRLWQTWQETLHTPLNHVSEKFTELGIPSIKWIELANALGDEFQQAIDLHWLMRFPTIEMQAKQLQHSQIIYQPIISLNRELEQPPLCLVHPAFSGVECYAIIADQLSGKIPCVGVDSYNLYSGHPQLTSIKQHACYYLEQLLKQVKTIEFLGGWSLGGLIAFEMAQQLCSAGYAPPTLIMVDTHIFDAEQLKLVLPLINKDRAGKILPAHIAQYLKTLPEKKAEILIDNLKNDFKMMANYQAKTYPGVIKLIKATRYTKLNFGALTKKYNGWDEFCENIEVVRLDANHHNIVYQGDGLQVANIIENFMGS